MQLNFYQDPGHGWVRVSKKLIRELKIKTEISSSSYVKHPYVYLEEDGDLAVFLRAMEKIGKKVTFKEFHTDNNSRIRNYIPYSQWEI